MHIQVQSTPDYPVWLDNPGKYKISLSTVQKYSLPFVTFISLR